MDFVTIKDPGGDVDNARDPVRLWTMRSAREGDILPAMQPWHRIDAVATPDRRLLTLDQRGGAFKISVDEEELMTSRLHGSEEAMAHLALGALGSVPAPRMLIGGLGMGFTLRAALEGLGDRKRARVTVAEIFPAVVEWNRRWLGHLAGHPLDDRRVRVVTRDVTDLLAETPGEWDAILLDVDNGAEAFSLESNHRLYSSRGLTRLRTALAPGGVLAVWSADRDPGFERRLARGGFTIKIHGVRAHRNRQGKGKGPHHIIFLARVREHLRGREGGSTGRRARSRRASKSP